MSIICGYRFWHRHLVVIFLSLSVTCPLYGVDSLGVGWRGGGIPRWNRALAEHRFMALNQDSIWTWNVQPKSNLGPGIDGRGGVVLIPSASGGKATFLPDAGVLYDGDPNTAFDPDDFAERTELTRTSPIYIDLGATFRVNRIRLFPRLDGEHKQLFPRAFSLATIDELEEDLNLLERTFTRVFDFYPSNPNRQPVVEKRFASRDVRYIRLVVREDRRWELAEIEVYSDGTLPTGEFVSVPILATEGPRPLWGRVRYDGGDIQDLPVTVQTRSGPDREPLHYFRFTGIGADKERVSAAGWTTLDSVEQGPIIRNPAWSPWETVTDGLVRSPDAVPYIQFRLFIHEPGIAIKRLIIEYLNPPIAERLEAEVAPLLVDAGRETFFTVSLRTRIRRLRTDGSILPHGDTGFQAIQIETAARVDAVEKVLIDDREVDFLAAFPSRDKTSIRLRNTVLQDGTFIQVLLRATVFRDATHFDVQAIDQRRVDGKLIAVQQSAYAEDVDPLSLGGDLIVRVRDEQGQLPLLDQVRTSAGVFTPNGDGVNDALVVSYVLLKLTRAATAYFDIYDLSGRRIRHFDARPTASGRRTQIWDGGSDSGQFVVPGFYIWRLRLKADTGSVERQGIVGVVK